MCLLCEVNSEKGGSMKVLWNAVGLIGGFILIFFMAFFICILDAFKWVKKMTTRVIQRRGSKTSTLS